MNIDSLLSHFDRISDTPGAIPRMRRFILDLAVRGKLVEQDPKDEPASELLKRIQSEKVRLSKEGKGRKDKPNVPLVDDDLPFSIPAGWQWSQLATIGFISPRNDTDGALLASFVPMTLIPAEYGSSHSHEVRPWHEIKSGYTHFAEGDVGLAKITPCFENGKSTIFRGLTGGIGAGTTELHIVRPLLINADYVLLFLKCPHFIETGIPRMTGTAGQKRVSTEYFAYSPFPLPPLAEQQRIVAKVDELMALCDQLEAAQKEREHRRDRVVAASLNRLINGADAKSFREHARFYLRHLPRLTTRPEQIQQFRQTILNLAVRGKLVPQDPKDEPASELLKRIAKEKARLGLKHEVSPLGSDEIPFVLPRGWSWSRIGEVCSKTGSGSTPRGGQAVYKRMGIPFLRSQNVYDNGLRLDDVAYIDAATHARMDGTAVKPRDLLLNITGGSMGRCCRVPDIFGEANVSQHVAIIRTALPGIEDFLHRLVLSPYFQAFIFDEQTGAGRGGLPKNRMDRIAVALPPLAEQFRIVAKVNELLALCDKLEAQLTTTALTSHQLLEATIHQAISGQVELEQSARR